MKFTLAQLQATGLPLEIGPPVQLPVDDEPTERNAMPAMTWTLNIPGWTPTPLNQLVNKHWGAASRAKKQDKATVAEAMMIGGIPAATSKRRVELLIVHPKGKRFCDKDAYQKSLLDAMVQCGLLKNDSHVWADVEKPEYARGESLRTVITLTDL